MYNGDKIESKAGPIITNSNLAKQMNCKPSVFLLLKCDQSFDNKNTERRTVLNQLKGGYVMIIKRSYEIRDDDHKRKFKIKCTINTPYHSVALGIKCRYIRLEYVLPSLS